MAFTKHAIYAAANNTLAAQIALEAKYQDKLGKSNDLLEGASAFLQKRPAKFTGT